MRSFVVKDLQPDTADDQSGPQKEAGSDLFLDWASVQSEVQRDPQVVAAIEYLYIL